MIRFCSVAIVYTHIPFHSSLPPGKDQREGTRAFCHITKAFRETEVIPVLRNTTWIVRGNLPGPRCVGPRVLVTSSHSHGVAHVSAGAALLLEHPRSLCVSASPGQTFSRWRTADRGIGRVCAATSPENSHSNTLPACSHSMLPARNTMLPARSQHA